MMHSDAYTLCNLDSQTYSTLPAPYNHQHHYHHPAVGGHTSYLHQNDSNNYFQHAAADGFRGGAGWASCGASSGHVIDATSGDACVKRSRTSGGFYDSSAAAMMLYGHHPGVARPPGTAAFDFPFPGFCTAGADVASSNTGSGCGYVAAAAAAAFYGGVDSVGTPCGGVLRSRSADYGADSAMFYPGYADQPPPAHLPSTNGQSSLELCSGAGSEFTALCGSGQRTGQPHSPTAVTVNDSHRGADTNCSSGGLAHNSAATYKWMTVKRGAPKSTGQL